MIGAVVLAAGQSKRMGTPKSILPWGKTTIIEKIIQVLFDGNVDNVVVVTGAVHQTLEKVIKNTSAKTVFNHNYKYNDMALSLQMGIRALPETVDAILIVLGDQPQILAETVKVIIQTFYETSASIIVPSYQMHKGHPWLISQFASLEIYNIKPPKTLHDFLCAYESEIHYLSVETPTIFQDVDTPEDYEFYCP